MRILIARLVLLVALLPQAAAAQDRPDPTVTPGATNPNITEANIAQTLCNPKWSTKTIRPPASYTTKLKRTQMHAAGDTRPNPLPRVKTARGKGTRPNLTKCVPRSGNPACYEEDHRVPLELGGNPTDPKNLWPQPWFGAWNAHKKDVLENLIHKQLCSGQLTLSQAQAVFLSDWVDGYQRYVGK